MRYGWISPPADCVWSSVAPDAQRAPDVLFGSAVLGRHYRDEGFNVLGVQLQFSNIYGKSYSQNTANMGPLRKH